MQNDPGSTCGHPGAASLNELGVGPRISPHKFQGSASTHSFEGLSRTVILPTRFKSPSPPYDLRSTMPSALLGQTKGLSTPSPPYDLRSTVPSALLGQTKGLSTDLKSGKTFY